MPKQNIGGRAKAQPPLRKAGAAAEISAGESSANTVVYEISVKIRQAEKFASHLTKILRREYNFNFTTIIVIIIGRRLLDKVIYRIKICIKAGKAILAIIDAVKVAKKTIYKMRLNLDIWGEPYAPPTVVLRRPRALLPYQKTVIYNIIVLSFLLTAYVEAS